MKEPTLTITQDGRDHKLKIVMEKSAAGSEGLFLPVNDTEAYKCYGTQEEAISAHERQTLAHLHDIAPAVLSGVVAFDFPMNRFRTGLSKAFDDNDYGRDNEFIFKEGWAYKTQIAHEVTSEEVQCGKGDLKRKMSSLDMGTGDICKNNCGMIDGKLVCIDFGDAST